MIWLTTDTHFGHTNIIRYCGRPVDFEQKIYTSWRKNVRNGDIIIHLGDVVFGSLRRTFYQDIFPSLPGHKILIRGNHDRTKDLKYWDETYQKYDMKIGKWSVRLQHRPAVPPPQIDWLIHGHVHNALKPSESSGKCVLAALEWEGYKVWPLREWFLRMIKGRY